jgi:hypothetical protein
MDNVIDQINQIVGGYMPHLAGALAILIFGWLVARIVAAIVRRGLARTNLDNRLARWLMGESVAIEDGIARGVYYLLMVLVLVAFFQALGLTLPTEPLNRLLNQIFAFAPQLIAAGVLLLVAWIVASLLRVVLLRVLTAARLDQRLADQTGLTGEQTGALSQTLADTAYWLVWLFFLPALLNALSLAGLLNPVQGMINKVLEFLPNILSAALILGVGWLVARIVQRVVANLLAAAGMDQFSDRIGLAAVLGQQRLSGVVGLIIYVLILIPVLIAALQALALEAITRPASNMLNSILSAFPAIFAALLIVGVAYAIGRVVAGMATNLLSGIGFNTVLARLGLGREPQTGVRTPAEIAGYLILVGILLFAAIEAVRELGFTLLADLIARFTVFAGHVILGLIIFGIGLFLANIATTTVRASGAAQAGLLALAARVSIIVLAGAMALRQMGLADDIINMAFGLLLGAIAVAVALAFGLGAREIAARELAEWVQFIKSRK